ncbi:response regulator [Azospirillum sp. Vi22]|nr:response regulator [Azospirillum baldaniorum]
MTEAHAMARILLVDDMPLIRKTVGRLLREHGHEVVAAADGKEALAALGDARADRTAFDAALLDIWMPRVGGLELMRTLRELCPDLPVIIMSGGGPRAPLEYSLAVAEAEGAAAVLVKPFEDQQLLDVLAVALGS